MRIFSGVASLILLVLMVGFALENKQMATVVAWPLEGAREAPMYIIVLGPFLFGLVFGGMWGWLSGVPHRFRAWKLHKELGGLNDKIGELQKASTLRHAQVVPKKSFWGSKT